MPRPQPAAVSVAAPEEFDEAAESDEVEEADVPITGPGEDQTEHHRNHISCIRNGGTPNCGIDLGLRVQVMLSMAEMSYRQSTMSLFDTEKLKLIAPKHPIA